MRKILIIEDDQDMALVLKKNLESQGFRVLVAHDGLEGTKTAHNEKPDLIILDLNLPAGGGDTILHALKLSTNTNAIPVLILTGTSDEELKKQVQRQDIADFIIKPYELPDLVSRIRGILNIDD